MNAQKCIVDKTVKFWKSETKISLESSSVTGTFQTWRSDYVHSSKSKSGPWCETRYSEVFRLLIGE